MIIEMSFIPCPTLDGYEEKKRVLITDQHLYQGPEIYYYKCLIDYIYQFLIDKFPKTLHIEHRIVNCQALANEIIAYFNDPTKPDVDGHIYTEARNNAEFHSACTFHIFDNVLLFDPEYWCGGQPDSVYDKMKQNYNNLKSLCRLTKMCPRLG